MCVSPWFNTRVQSSIPCGGCLGCRLDKMALWSARAVSELKKGRNAFVTFTYNSYELPFNSNAVLPTLSKVHIHNYLDNLRHLVKNSGVLPFGCRPDYKYYVVGEYGDSFQRPHYHCLFFGLDFKDMSSFFSKSWHYGSIKSLPVNSSSIRYVLDYMTKSFSGSYAVDLYDNKFRERPFSSNSKGFGYDFFVSRKDEINRLGFVKIAGRLVPIPTYYKNLFCSYDPDSVSSRLAVRQDFYDKQKILAFKSGFNSVSDYQNYSRSCLGSSLFSSSVSRGRAVDSAYLLQDLSGLDYVLSDSY